MSSRVVLVQHAKNEGAGGAIATGYKYCEKHEIDISAVMDGDAQMDPGDLIALIDPVAEGEVDCTKGNRFSSGDAWKTIPRVRYLGNAALSLLTKIASGYWHIADSQTGYRTVNLKALQTVNWSRMYKRYGYPNDWLVRLNVYNFRVRDIPIRPVYGIGEKSGFQPLSMIPKLSWLLFKLFLWRMKEKYIIRDFHPLIFFYILAFTLLFFSLPLFIRLLWFLMIVGRIPPINTMAFMFTAILGLQSMCFAMWFDMEYNRDLK
jgi:glycosyltransferase involved in cell wall biosynthesis